MNAPEYMFITDYDRQGAQELNWVSLEPHDACEGCTDELIAFYEYIEININVYTDNEEPYTVAHSGVDILFGDVLISRVRMPPMNLTDLKTIALKQAKFAYQFAESVKEDVECMIKDRIDEMPTSLTNYRLAEIEGR